MRLTLSHNANPARMTTGPSASGAAALPGHTREMLDDLPCSFGVYHVPTQSLHFLNRSARQLLGNAAPQSNSLLPLTVSASTADQQTTLTDLLAACKFQACCHNVLVHPPDASPWPAILLGAPYADRPDLFQFLLMPLDNLGSCLQELTEQSVYFKTTIDHATIGIIICDAAGKILLANRFACTQFGYQRDELINQEIEMLVPANLMRKHQEHRHKFMQNLQDRPMGIGLDLYARRKDGTVFPVEISLGHYITAGGPHVVAFINDIAIRKKNEEALLHQQQVLRKYAEEVHQLNAQLEQRVEERTQQLLEAMQQLERSRQELSEALRKEKELSDLKSRFISMASHEFRTPLSTILSSIELLKKYVNSAETEKQVRHIRRIQENVQHLTTILEDFLSVDRLEEGRVSVNRQPVHLPDLINTLADELRETAREGPTILCEHSGKPEVITDAQVMKNILLNLIGNAIKYTPPHGTVRVSSSITNSDCRIAVRDTGVGIAEADLPHIGDRFFRGTNVLHIKGTGLGLHIVNKYLELLGGTLQAHSTLGKGSEFIITIPMAKHEDHTDH